LQISSEQTDRAEDIELERMMAGTAYNPGEREVQTDTETQTYKQTQRQTYIQTGRETNIQIKAC